MTGNINQLKIPETKLTIAMVLVGKLAACGCLTIGRFLTEILALNGSLFAEANPPP
jgi:hypothetical protein